MLSMPLVASYWFWCTVFSLSLIPIMIPSLCHRLFEWVLYNFQIFGGVPFILIDFYFNSAVIGQDVLKYFNMLLRFIEMCFLSHILVFFGICPICTWKSGIQNILDIKFYLCPVGLIDNMLFKFPRSHFY